MQPGLAAERERIHVPTAGGLALFTSRWTLRTPDGAAQSFVANVVLCLQADGGWKVVIDNARDPLVLEDAGRYRKIVVIAASRSDG